MIISFWCRDCRLDQDIPAIKREFRDTEWFSGNCKKCGNLVKRHITEKQDDPYFYESMKIRYERECMKMDLIQPGETGFETFYKKEYDKMELAKEKWYNKEAEKKKARDAFLKKHSENIVEKNIAKKIIEREMVHG